MVPHDVYLELQDSSPFMPQTDFITADYNIENRRNADQARRQS